MLAARRERESITESAEVTAGTQQRAAQWGTQGNGSMGVGGRQMTSGSTLLSQ